VSQQSGEREKLVKKMIIRYPDYSSFDTFLEYFERVNDVALKEHEIQYFIDHPEEAQARTVDLERIRDEVINDKSLDENSKRALVPRLENSLKQLGYYRNSSTSRQNNGPNSGDYWKGTLASSAVAAISAASLAYLLGKEHGKQEAFVIKEEAKEIRKQFDDVQQQYVQQNVQTQQQPQIQAQQAQHLASQQQEELMKKLFSVFIEAQNIGGKVEEMEKGKKDEKKVEERRKEAEKLIKKYTA
jgi:membrane-associated HD superfamily phosphohydrolase